jgi:multiple sugar transport system permease protein
MSRTVRRRLAWGLLFISPWVIGFLGFTVYPMLASFYYSFTTYDVVRPPIWVGLENYRDLFAKDALALKSVYNTVYYAVISVPLGIVVAVAVSLLLNARIKGLAVFRAIFFLPSVVPAVASIILWIWLLSTNFGLLNLGLNAIGLPKVGWLSDPAWTKPALILMGLWGFGGAMVIYLAGLQDIPKVFYEAASIDGANSLQKIFSITLPLLTPQIFFNLVTGLIGAFQVFTSAFIMGGATGSASVGGPGNSLLFYSLYLYLNAFSFFKMGYASAMAWILFLMTMVTTLIVLRTARAWVYYGGVR